MKAKNQKVNRLTLRFIFGPNFSWRVGFSNQDLRMLSFPEAFDILLKNSSLVSVESCRLEESAGRILRQTLVADRPFPAFDRVMMDGFALRSEDWAAGLRQYRVTGIAPAGKPLAALSSEQGVCFEAMTGAPCPEGADCIVPIEEVLQRSTNKVEFSELAAPVAGRFIHRAGSDVSEGSVLLEQGQRLGSREIGIAASCGAAWLDVSQRPKIAVIATGDELVAVEQVPALHQIRQSNAHSIAAALTLAGYAPRHVGGVIDDLTVARPLIEELLATYDWVVLTGAVSMGAYDFVPALLADLGCKKLFHGVAQRPGKPVGCWLGPKGNIVLGLPGNPVSALTGFYTLLLPALTVASGAALPSPRRVVMDNRSQQLVDFTRHLPVSLRADGRAEPAATGNSGDFIGLLQSDGFLTLPPRGLSEMAFPFTPWL